MPLKVLTPALTEEFIERGYTVLPEAFPRDLAAEIRRLVLEKIDAREDDPSTWKPKFGARSHLADSFKGEPWMSACTPRYGAGLDDLMGEGRWLPIPDLGWWPVLFPGFDAPPWRPHEDEWHIDGGFFHHYLDSPEQGMLPIFLFSDIGPGDGGTAVSIGSHKLAARVLRDAQPNGLSQAELGRRVKALHYQERLPVVELRGRAGDVAFVHPFVLHTVSTNIGGRVRVICNPHVHFRERMNVTGDATRAVSPVEEAILRALREPAAAAS